MATLTAIDLEDFLPATFTAPQLTDEQFLAMCELFPDATLEYMIGLRSFAIRCGVTSPQGCCWPG